jgi:hypothetical protein
VSENGQPKLPDPEAAIYAAMKSAIREMGKIDWAAIDTLSDDELRRPMLAAICDELGLPEELRRKLEANGEASA